jgi:hypothetical protein
MHGPCSHEVTVGQVDAVVEEVDGAEGAEAASLVQGWTKDGFDSHPRGLGDADGEDAGRAPSLVARKAPERRGRNADDGREDIHPAVGASGVLDGGAQSTELPKPGDMRAKPGDMFAKSEDDLTAGGLQKRTLKASAGALRPPESLDITFPRRLRGEFTASAHQTGVGRGRYAAQLSTDANMPTTWVDLRGYGKSRKVKGYKSGTQVWLRFAQLSGQDQSDWGTPVLVTVP